jgi:hypothetical protein
MEDTESISCADHHDTWQTGYSYESEASSQTQYGTCQNYQNCFITAHQVRLGTIEKDFSAGKICTGSLQYGDAERLYGAYTLSVPLDIPWLIRFTLNLSFFFLISYMFFSKQKRLLEQKLYDNKLYKQMKKKKYEGGIQMNLPRNSISSRMVTRLVNCM